MITMSLVVNKLLTALCISAQWTHTAESNSGEVITASSSGFKFSVYSVPGLAEGFRVTNVTLIKQHSSSACIYGHSFGHNKTKIWVDKGCRGDFLVQTKEDDDITNNISIRSYLTSSTLLPALTTQDNIWRTSATEPRADEPEVASHNSSLLTSNVGLQTRSSSSSTTVVVFEKTARNDSSMTRTISTSFSSSTGLDPSASSFSSEYLSTHTTTSPLLPSFTTNIRLDSTTVKFVHTSANTFTLKPPATTKDVIPQSTPYADDKPSPDVDTMSTSITEIPISTVPPMLCCCNRTGLYRELPEKYISQIVKRLQVDVKKLSRSMRRKNSASDHRFSSTSMGMVGLAFLILVPTVVILSDLFRLVIKPKTTKTVVAKL